MSEENVEIVRRLVQAWSDHDREALARCYAPDSLVVTLHRAIANGRASGIQTVRELGAVEDGLVVRHLIHLDRNEALAAAGLDPRG